MNDLLSEFEQQFGVITAEITTKISCIINNDGDNSYKLIKEVKNLISDAVELLEHMELEVKEAPQDQREKLKTRVKSYEVELKRLEGDFKKVQSNFPQQGSIRKELFSGGQEIDVENEEDQRQCLLNNTESLERTSLRLVQSYKAAVDSEHVGAQILNDLQHQRETLKRARERLHDTDEDLNQSSRVLNTMIKRAMQNKFLLGAVLTFVVVVISVIIYVKIS